MMSVENNNGGGEDDNNDDQMYGNQNYFLWGLGIPSREVGDSPSPSRSNNSTPGLGMFMR